jgi:hypothetical protein
MQPSRMLITLISGTALSTTALAQSALVEGYRVCGKVITEGIRNYSVDQASDYVLKVKHDAYCDGRSVRGNIDTNADVSIPIEGIPSALKGTGNVGYQQLQNFCGTFYDRSQQITRTFSYEERIVTEGYQTFQKCMEIVGKGGHIYHESPSVEALNFYVEPGRAQVIRVDGIALAPDDAPVACSVTYQGTLFGTRTTPVLRSTSISTDDNRDRRLNFTCVRKPVRSQDGEYFREAVVTLATGLGNYSVLLPQDAKLPLTLASQINGEIGALRSSVTALRKELDTAKARISETAGLIPTKINIAPTGTVRKELQDAPCPTGQVAIGVGQIGGIPSAGAAMCGTLSLGK